jgi:adenine-specific DNA methylase
MEFTNRLAEAFCEIARVLKPKGLAAFTYQHSLAEGWSALAEAISRSPLVPMMAFPLAGNGDVGLHASDGASTYDAVIVLRRRIGHTRANLRASPAAVETAAEKLHEFNEMLDGAPRPFTQADRTNLWRALLVVHALRAAGGSVPIDDLLRSEPVERNRRQAAG